MVRGLLFQRYGDLLVAVVLAAILITEIVRWHPADLALAVPAGLLATLPLALRRKNPLVSFVLVAAGTTGVLLVAEGLDNHSTALVVIVLFAPYSLGRYCSGHDVWLGGLAVVASVILFDLYDDARFDRVGFVFSLGFIGGPWIYGVALKLRRDREARLTARTRELERVQAERARQAVASERARIAQELHDVVSHAIAITVLQARGGRNMLGVDEGSVRRSLDAIEHTNTQALSDMRRLLFLLRDTDDPGDAAPPPSLARLTPLLAELRESGLPVTLTMTGNGDDVPPGIDISAYRIIQEALTNVVKHAGPATATVSITHGSDDLHLVVEDTGASTPTASKHGLGLIGIRERVAVVGGQVEAGPNPRGGFRVNAHLPYSVQE
jgi:signal transduction histidine kinase